MNSVNMVGRITKDPELKYTQSNIPVVSFILAVNRQFTNENGERQADFIQCVAWRKQAENMEKYVKKGNLLGIEGRISTRSYEDNDGKTVYITEVVCDSVHFLESKDKDQDKSNNQRNEEYKKFTSNDSDLPF